MAIKTAKIFIVPDEIRGHILKLESRKECKFIVIPNRMHDDLLLKLESLKPSVSNMDCNLDNFFKNKVIIYQGLMHYDRCVIEVIKAFKQIEISNLGLLLMGDCFDEQYKNDIIAEIKNQENIVWIGRIPFPNHLIITKKCHYGILLYRPNSINNYFCAPNKLYEYSLLGLGIIMSKSPCLSKINDKYNIGVYCDPENVEDIKRAIISINQYKKAELENNCKKFLKNDINVQVRYKNLFDQIKYI